MIKDRIREDMKAAMRAHDAAGLSTIRLLLAAIKQREVDEQIEADDALILSVIAKMVKQRQDSVQQYLAGDRQDLADKESAEIKVLEAYLPKGLSDEEIAAECKSWATYGKPADRQRNIVTSLELQSEKMEIINKRLQEKYKALEENEVRYEAIDCDDADYVIVAFGSSARICSATVEMARAEGLKVGLLRPITLYPFPKKPLAELAARGVKGFLSAELNAGQMVEDVRLAVNGAAPVEHFGRQGGMMFAPDEVLAALKEKLIKK